MKKKMKQSTKKVILIVLCCILSLILAALLSVVIVVNSLLNKINRPSSDDPTWSPEQLESMRDQTGTGGPGTGNVDTPDGPAGSINVGDNIINVLLVGQDRRPGEPRLHSDSMILCTINKSNKTITLTSFMRDVWLTIPDAEEPFDQRLNFAYLWGGFDLLNKTLDYNFGVSASKNVEVDFNGFKKIIDYVGGVDIKLTAAEARYLNERGNWDAGEAYDGSWTLTEGVNHLDSSQALAYSRIRDIGGDYARTERQRTMITALIAKAKTMNISQLYKFAETALPMLTTDMDNRTILNLVAEIAPILPEMKIISQRIPAENAYYEDWVRGNAVLLLTEEDRQKNIQILKDTMGKK